MEKSFQRGFRLSLGVSTVTGAIGVGGVPSLTDFPPPCSLHSVQLRTLRRCYFTILRGLLFHIQRAMLILLTERVGAVGVRRWLRLFGLQVREAWSLGMTWKWIQGGFGSTRMQAWVGRGRLLLLLLHQQGLGQLTLVLLDLLLHVIDCTCNLGKKINMMDIQCAGFTDPVGELKSEPTCCSCCRMGPETLRCACNICCWICKRWYACAGINRIKSFSMPRTINVD